MLALAPYGHSKKVRVLAPVVGNITQQPTCQRADPLNLCNPRRFQPYSPQGTSIECNRLQLQSKSASCISVGVGRL